MTPCWNCPKLPADTPLSRRTPAEGRRQEATPRSLAVMRHYRECRAVGDFPKDGWVRRHAALLHEAESALEAARARRRDEALLALLGARG